MQWQPLRMPEMKDAVIFINTKYYKSSDSNTEHSLILTSVCKNYPQRFLSQSVDPQTFSLKGQIVHILDSAGHMASVTTTNSAVVRNEPQTVGKQMCALCASKNSWWTVVCSPLSQRNLALFFSIFFLYCSSIPFALRFKLILANLFLIKIIKTKYQ